MHTEREVRLSALLACGGLLVPTAMHMCMAARPLRM